MAPSAHGSHRIPTYSRLEAQPTREMPAALRNIEMEPAFREQNAANFDRLLAPGLRPSEDSSLFITLGASATSVVTISLPGGGRGLAVFSALIRALDYGNVQLSGDRLVIKSYSPREMVNFLQSAASAGVV